MYTCKLCGLKLDNVRLYVQHCRVHSNLPKLRLPCCFSNCLKTSSSFTGLKMHMSRDHGRHGKGRSMVDILGVQETFDCCVVSCLVKCTGRSNIIKHMRQHIKEGMTMNCPIKGCNKRYRIASSFSCHLSRDHAHWCSSDLKPALNSDPIEPQPVVTDTQSILTPVVCDEDEDDSAVTEPLPVARYDFVQNLSLFFARLSTRQLIPDSTVDVIAQELQSISALNQSYIKQKVELALRGAGACENVFASVTSAIDANNLLKVSLESGGDLCSTAKRASFVKQNFRFVKPQPVYVGKSSRNKNRHCHYVPIRDSLATLLQDASVIQQCVLPQQESGSILRDFTDGSVYKMNTADPGEKYLSLILYQDSFEVANPLGSAKKRHKVLGVYFLLGSLEYHNRSNVDNMQLVLLANENDFDHVGQQIFSRLVCDLQSLENDGIIAGGVRYTVILAAIAGDNLGSHCIGGFVKKFSCSQHMCRFCVLTKRELDNGCISECQVSVYFQQVEIISCLPAWSSAMCCS